MNEPNAKGWWWWRKRISDAWEPVLVDHAPDAQYLGGFCACSSKTGDVILNPFDGTTAGGHWGEQLPTPRTAPPYIHFNPVDTNGRKTRLWNIHANGNQAYLGEVKWYGPWRCYSFFPGALNSTVFEKQCLRDIAAFCEQQTELHRSATKAAKNGNGKVPNE